MTMRWLLITALTVLALKPAPSPPPPWHPVATFSILGFDPDSREIGAAVQSRVFSVGNGVLWADAEVGAVATQAIVDVSYGPKGIALLKNGIAPRFPAGPRSIFARCRLLTGAPGEVLRFAE